MSHDDSGHCFFVRQPSNGEQVDAAIRAVWTSCCAAVRYGGTDAAILTRMGRLGELSRCDNSISPVPSIVVRDCARFEYRTPEGSPSVRSDLKRIIQFIADSFSSKYAQCSGFRFWLSSGSFRYQWGSPVGSNSIRFHVESQSEGRWLLRMSENEIARIGMAIRLDVALQGSQLFERIQWFSADEIASGVECGEAHPY